jgi:acetylornithine deacetylase/succinyl-diaminopimelate desuccinylase-like protein
MDKLIGSLIDLAIQIQQIPAPTFEESRRAEFVRGLFIKENLKDISMDAVGNVYARLRGNDSSARPLIVSAHLDTVFPNGTNLTVRREAGRVYGPGIGDNSLGVAALFGLLWRLRSNKIELHHDVWFVANVGEEGLGDLRGMREVVSRFGGNVTGYLVLEGLALGHVYHQAIGVQRYRIHVETAGGHSWSDYGNPSAVHELAALVTKLTSLEMPSAPRTTMNVGTINGGTGVNVIASEAICELDLRSENPIALNRLIDQVEGFIRAANRVGVKTTFELIGQRPAGEIPAEHPLIQTAVRLSQARDLTATLTAGSTDANIPLSKGYPALVLGITTGGGAHTLNEFVEVEPVQKGMDVLVKYVEEAAGVGEGEK